MLLKIGAFLTLLSAIIIYYQKELGIYLKYFDFLYNNEQITKDLYTVDELSKYDGVKSNYLYLSILGEVYDVTSGKQHYEPGADYNIFIGRDASKSFITGEFSDTNKDLDNVLELSPKELLDLKNWKKMYEKQYIYKGKLIGRFYDKHGKTTEYMINVMNKIQEAIDQKSLDDKLDREYPPCNSEWQAATGARVWCSNKSGGIARSWEGVPRLLFTVDSSEPRCVCVRNVIDAQNNPNLKGYADCNPSSTSCQVPNTAD